MKKTALLVVDLQNDFLPNGALAVREGDTIIPLINRLIRLPFDVKVASRDWHPQKHCSFASTWGKKVLEVIRLEDIEQILWPDHCVQNSPGAEFSKEIDVSVFDFIVSKGIDERVDSYSTFFDNKKERSTGLAEYLRAQGIQEIYFAGLTTDYCVFYSAMDALELDFDVHVIVDACMGVELHPGDVEKACETMKKHGVTFHTTEEVIEKFQRV